MSSRFIHGIACQNFLLFKAEYSITCIYHILFIHEWTSRLPGSLTIVNNAAIDSWVGKIPWRRAWQPTPVFLPGESYEQRSLFIGRLQSTGHKESDTTEASEHSTAHTGIQISLCESDFNYFGYIPTIVLLYHMIILFSTS